MDYLIEFEYDADEEDELTIRKGDIVNFCKPHEDGWMMGVLRGKEGVFPSNFGKPLKEEKRKSQDEILITSTTEESKLQSNIKDEVIAEPIQPPKKVTGVGFGNIFSGGEIKLKTTNRDTKPKVINEENKPEVAIEKKPNNRVKELVRAVHSYNAENADELTLEIGDILTVINKEDEDEGWWKGQKANGQVGVFPDNFVEPYKSGVEENHKPNRVSTISFNKTAPPPPVIAAKPKIVGKNIPPRPPQLTDKQVTITKPVSQITNQEKDDGISFDSPINHKPLVGPNAGRAKRPGKKLPTSVNIITGNDEKPIDEEEKKIITPKSNVKDLSVNIETSLTKQKSKETPTEKIIENNTHSKLKSKESILTDKAHDNFTETCPQISHKKPVNTSKACTLPREPTTDKDINSNNTSTSKIDSDFKKDLLNLQSKMSDLEEENSILRSEISELRKSSTDQINNLKTKINKLTNELDEEKTKRAANEVNLTRLKDTVDDLEAAMLSLSHK